MAIRKQAANAQFVDPNEVASPDVLANILLGVGGLPLATTPLAGTETMYVVQGGTLCAVPASTFVTSDVDAAAPVSSNITAAGTTLAQATLLTGDVNFITAGTSATAIGVQLPVTPVPPNGVRVVNTMSFPVNVYPNTGQQIDTLGTTVASQIPGYGSATFLPNSTTQWWAR
jgi:uncharacterized membrane protein